MKVKGLKQEHIDNNRNFSVNLENFLRRNKECVIEDIITHKPYHITILYREIDENEEIENIKNQFSKLYYG